MTHGPELSRQQSLPPEAKQDLTALMQAAMRKIGPQRDPKKIAAAQAILDQVKALGRELTPTEHRRVLERLEAL